MKQLSIIKLTNPLEVNDYLSASLLLNDIAWNNIDQVAWPDQYPYKPEAKFQIAYTDHNIIIHFDVQEEFVKAQFIRPNENVWEDSCVEFFLSLDNKETYYNFEFNALGTGLIGYGPSIKTERSRLAEDQILTVDSLIQVKTIKGKKSWQQILIIPIELFGITSNELPGKLAHANFYKCGDGLPNPHFISWNLIENPTPNFHLPQYFGEIRFE